MTKVCDALGIPIGLRLSDDGISASRFATKEREDWPKVEAEISSGRWTHFAYWALNRQSRQLAEWAHFRDLCRKHGVRWITRGGQVLDLNDSGTRIGLGVQKILDEEFSEALSEDIRRTLTARAVAGRPHGRHGYGYRRVYSTDRQQILSVEIVAEEAEVLRWAADAVLRGHALIPLCRELNEAGVPSPAQAIRVRLGREPGEGKWESTALRKLLLSPRSAGLREHKGDLYPADWEGIWTTDYRRRLIGVLKDPRRNDRRGRPGRIAHWLSGVLVCSLCHSAMRHRTANGATYTCAGCTKVSIRASAVEDALCGALTVAVDPGFLRRRADPQVGATRAERAVLQQRLDEIEAAILAGDMPAVMGGRLAMDLTQKVAALTDLLDALAGPTPLHIPTPEELERDWPEMTPAQKRTLFLHVLGRVEVTPSGRNRWLPPMSRCRLVEGDERLRDIAARLAS